MTNPYHLSTGLWLTFLYLLVTPTLAIDNPDATNFIEEFQSRAQTFKKDINNPNNSTQDYLIAYEQYQIFLDKELNMAYRLLKSKLPTPQVADLKKSQRNWIKFRDAEFELIKNNWTRKNFGSSAGISRGTYRCSLIENRVTQLLHYAKNY